MTKNTLIKETTVVTRKIVPGVMELPNYSEIRIEHAHQTHIHMAISSDQSAGTWAYDKDGLGHLIKALQEIHDAMEDRR